MFRRSKATNLHTLFKAITLESINERYDEIRKNQKKTKKDPKREAQIQIINTALHYARTHSIDEDLFNKKLLVLLYTINSIKTDLPTNSALLQTINELSSKIRGFDYVKYPIDDLAKQKQAFIDECQPEGALHQLCFSKTPGYKEIMKALIKNAGGKMPTQEQPSPSTPSNQGETDSNDSVSSKDRYRRLR